MAGSTVLERTTEKTAEKTAQTRELSAAEREHNERKAGYMKLLYADEEPEAEFAPAMPVATVAEAAPELAPSNAAARIADYRGYAAPASKHTLFDGIIYKDGELVSDVAVKTAPVMETVVAPAPAPVMETVVAPAVAPAPVAVAEVVTAPVSAPAEEDALPTQRTMDTLRQTAETAASARTHLFAGISTRAKVVLAAIAFAIVLAVVIICVNTGIINRLDAHIETLRDEVAEEQMKYEAVEQEKQQYLDYEGAAKEIIDEFAKSHGMVRG